MTRDATIPFFQNRTDDENSEDWLIQYQRLYQFFFFFFINVELI